MKICYSLTRLATKNLVGFLSVTLSVLVRIGQNFQNEEVFMQRSFVPTLKVRAKSVQECVICTFPHYSNLQPRGNAFTSRRNCERMCLFSTVLLLGSIYFYHILFF